LLWLSLALVAVVGANLLGLRLLGGNSHHFHLGFWGDQELLAAESFYEPEKDGAGTTYRWTRAHSSLMLRGFAVAPDPWLTLSVGGLAGRSGPPRLTTIMVDQTALLAAPVEARPRDYHLMLPATALGDGKLDLDLLSATSAVPPDPRQLGLRLDALSLAWASGAWALPTWQTLLVQMATALSGAAIAWRLELPRALWAVLVVALAMLLGWMTAYDLFSAAAWHVRTLVGSLLLLALAWRGLPLLGRLMPDLSRPERRWIAAIVVLGCAVRLLGVAYPRFNSQDLDIHQRRLLDVQSGFLYLFDKPTEFGRAATLVPPAFYLLALPFKLLTPSSGLALHTWYACLDGLNALLVALLARCLGASARAAGIAAALIALLPIQFTAIWWGFGPQIAGQTLILALAVLAARERITSTSAWLLAATLWSLALLTHPGVTLLGGVWLVGYVILLWWFHRERRDLWRSWALVLVTGCLVALLLLYSPFIRLYLAGLTVGRAEALGDDNRARLIELAKGIRMSVRPLHVLALLGLITLARVTDGPRRWLVVAWLGSAGAFLVVDVVAGLQVRYGYFTIPLICAGLAWWLDRQIARTRWAWLAVAGVIGVTAYSGLPLWYQGVTSGVKPAMAALTH
jgi:hypothetical protein